jgi:mono/diheme cytochrome c family protein
VKRATLAVASALSLFAAVAIAEGDAQRGLYLSRAGGCVGCHTEAKEGAQAYAGGRALKTAFGTFFGPNITPHSQAGIGRWTEADFIRALRLGERPDGAHYYPAFPYPSFTKVSDQDLKDLWAYLRTVRPSDRPSRAHELRFPFSWRPLLWGWKRLFFKPGPFVPDRGRAPIINRGAYLVQALGHCGECHTPRNFLGGPREDRFLAGGKLPDKGSAPNLTPTRLKKQSDKELAEVLQTGVTDEGDALAESMAEVVRNTTSQLTPEDLGALIAYLRSLPPLPEEPK